MQVSESNLSDDIRRYLGILSHWLWLFIIAALIGGGTAYIYSKQTTPVYQSSSTFLINEAPGSGGNSYNTLLVSQRNQSTYLDLVTRDKVLQGVIDALKLNNQLTLNQLKNAITTQAVRDTVMVTIIVQDTNPQRAADIANELIKQLQTYVIKLQSDRYASSKDALNNQIGELDRQINDIIDQKQNLSTSDPQYAQLDANLTAYRLAKNTLVQSLQQISLTEEQSISTIIAVEEAKPGKTPIKPRTLTNTLIGALGSLVLAIAGVFAAEMFDDTLRDPADVERITGLPVLGAISRYDTSQSELIAHVQPRTPVAEAFRSIRTNIQFASVDKPPRVILVTSPSPSDGKSTIAANLSVVLAQSEKKVVLIDTDLRRPRVHKLLGLANRHGLTEMFVQSEFNLDGISQETGINNMVALTSGGIPPNPSELLGSEKMQSILKSLQNVFDMVVIDSPPVLAVTDAAILSQRADGIILVVKPGQTKLAALRQAAEQLHRVGAHTLGVVINGVELKRSRYYYYYQYRGYYYSYYSNYTEEGSSKREKGGFVPRKKIDKESDVKEQAA